DLASLGRGHFGGAFGARRLSSSNARRVLAGNWLRDSAFAFADRGGLENGSRTQSSQLSRHDASVISPGREVWTRSQPMRACRTKLQNKGPETRSGPCCVC